MHSSLLIERLRDADRVAILTGAGISAESGIPTFRDPGGIWEEFEPQELANVDAFLANPERVQGWYRHRRQVVEEAEPNAGHRALVRLEDYVSRVTTITQNVDDLHNRAGSTAVVELHGNITHNDCVDCEATVAPERVDDAIEHGDPATCPKCGGLVRPDVVWFGEMLPSGAMDAASRAAQECDVFLSIGTSTVVYPAARLPVLAKESGAYVVEVNPNRTPISGDVDEYLDGPAGEVLPKIIADLEDG